MPRIRHGGQIFIAFIQSYNLLVGIRRSIRVGVTLSEARFTFHSKRPFRTSTTASSLERHIYKRNKSPPTENEGLQLKRKEGEGDCNGAVRWEES